MIHTISMIILGALIGIHLINGVRLAVERTRPAHSYDLNAALAVCANKIIGSIYIGTMLIAAAILLK